MWAPNAEPGPLDMYKADILLWTEQQAALLRQRDVIIAFWDGTITPDEALARLRRLPAD